MQAISNLIAWAIGEKPKERHYPENVVILHQYRRGLRAPSLSAFPLKLETWLRMADVTYQVYFNKKIFYKNFKLKLQELKNDFTLELSPTGKVPWIIYNGELVSDATFCLEFLRQKFNKDLSAHLSPVDQTIAHSFSKMAEESLRW